MTNLPKSYLTHLECPECGRRFDADQVQTYCPDCRSPLMARYDLARLRGDATREQFGQRPRGMWRWAELLPVRDPRYRLTLGEGDTPLLPLARTGAALGMDALFVKDEALNPTGSFKARGLCAAVSRALELGVREFVIPTAGNAGGALAAYAGRAGAPAHIYMPADTPRANQIEVQAAGADLHLVNGLINDAAREAGAEAAARGWFDVSTFKEPYRCEGKKTMGLELAEAFGWRLPDVILYPTGGGTGLVGMWKAFAELEALGWIGSQRPRMVSVQADGCAPIVRAFQQGAPRAEAWQNAHTLASGLRVPAVFADRQVLQALRESNGTALAVSDEDITAAQSELARGEGIFAAPEGAATLAGLHQLRQSGWIAAHETVVLFNTGSGLKYI
ncbi:threonine synthase [Longilinea arvoryzae]|uniref:Threonine synthase n=1 Tax=Longilinea arvoryzae TaxID=360412 RepID=A0A0S7BDM2_9CHLR|nr:threonine synthase [Longilinea arvoryzae]GAP12563.1 threonine synthase [Longilinea arvoryzae]